MLRNVSTLHGYTIHATDGELGTVDQFFFDDEHWTVRYLVVNAGNWLTGRLVLISPISIKAIDWDTQKVAVNLTRQQVENSPDLDTDQPVSRQKEAELYKYYDYPAYWGGPGTWGAGIYPGLMGGYEPIMPAVPDAAKQTGDDTQTPGDPHLRSTREVSNYGIQASNGEIGHVDDFIIDDQSWTIRYLVIDTRNWWPGKKVLLAPQWIQTVDWSTASVVVNQTREAIKGEPEYDPSRPLTREDEVALYAKYQQTPYWDEAKHP